MTGAERVRLAFLNAEPLFAPAPTDERPPSVPRPIKESQKSRESQVATLVAGLSQDQRDAFEERAAIMEFDGGYSRALAEYLARRVIVGE
ncbi:hypothetical protein ROA7450_04153 [Roseovarius albus]|uniref:Uncharacterized protein n=2 Tax=Roseovarius albus TaxID=1247867 RepID=A0A1X7A9D4_9RHOB|nr:hypothetical protein ROA7450_04153 [Roseovarius albus]